MHGPVHRNLVQRHALGVVQLSHPEHALLAGDIFRGIEHDAVELHPIAVPVGIALRHGDAPVQLPVREAEGTIADDVLDPRPGREAVGGLAELLDRGPVHRERAVMIHQLYEVGCGRVQPHLQGVVIQRLDAHRAEIIELPGGERFGICHRVEHVGVLVAHGRTQGALPGPHVVLRGQRIAVGPLRRRIEVKGDGQAVLADIPALRDTRLRLQCIRVLDCQSLEQSVHDIAFPECR